MKGILMHPTKKTSTKTTLTLLTALLLAPLAAMHAADAPPASLARDSGPAANLLQNPSFEEKAGDGVEGWMSRAWAGKEATRWSVETPGRTGERCVSIASDHGGDAAWTAMVSVQPGAWYRLSGWIKTREVRGAVGALLNIQNMQAVRTRAVSGTRDWTRVATVFQAEVARLEINCLYGGWGSSTGQAWYDDVVLEHVAEPPDETRAVVTIDTGAPSVPYSRMIFGGFLEHFERQIYGGVFEPGSPLSDENGVPPGRPRRVEGIESSDRALAGWVFRERVSLGSRGGEESQADGRHGVGRG